MMTWLPMTQSCATWVDIMNRLSSPTRVTPPPPAVPGFIVTCSRITLRAPITSSTRSPPYFRSCGTCPIEAKGNIVVPSPMRVAPASATWLCSITFAASTTAAPITQ
jgi:hypothetical protein